MIRWVSAVVSVMPHSICGDVIAEVRNENGRGNAAFAKSKLDPRAATAYARASTGAHIDSKPSVSRSAARSVPLSKQTMRAGAFPHQVVPQISACR